MGSFWVYLTTSVMGGLFVLGAFAINTALEGVEIKPEQNGRDFRHVVITMIREPCFGTCPYYSLTIHEDGTAVYEGIMFVNVTGKHIYEIEQDEVKKLVQEFYKIDYFSLEDRYEYQATDLPTTKTTITINGKTKTIVNYGVCADQEEYDLCAAPRELVELENKIDQITNASKWVVGE